MQNIKKIFRFFTIIFIVGIILISIWINIPVKKYPIEHIIGKKSFVKSKVSINSNNKFLAYEIIDFKFAKEHIIEKPIFRFLSKLAVYTFSPIEIIVVSSDCGQLNDLEYAIIVKSERLSRLADIASGVNYLMQRIGQVEPQQENCQWLLNRCMLDNDTTWTKHKDVIVFSKSRPLLIDTICFLEQETAAPVGNKYINKPGLFAYVYLDDSEDLLKDFVEKAREDFSYELFSTIDQLDSLDLWICDSVDTFFTAEIYFRFYPQADMDRARKDVWFFTQLLKRVFEANYYEFTHKMLIEEESVTLNITVIESKEGN